MISVLRSANKRFGSVLPAPVAVTLSLRKKGRWFPAFTVCRGRAAPSARATIVAQLAVPLLSLTVVIVARPSVRLVRPFSTAMNVTATFVTLVDTSVAHAALVTEHFVATAVISMYVETVKRLFVKTVQAQIPMYVQTATGPYVKSVHAQLPVFVRDAGYGTAVATTVSRWSTATDAPWIYATNVLDGED